MARISEAELERMKREVSIERLVMAKGIELKRHGADLIGRCPFHADTTPSLVVSTGRNLWHCLGACQSGGSVIDWVMKSEGVSFRHAVELLRNDSPSLSAPMPAREHTGGRRRSDGASAIKRATTAKLASVIERDADDARLMLQVMEYYHATLKQSSEALAYLEKRGLRSSEMIERFKLGYCDRTLCYRLPQANRVAGAEVRERLAKLGLLRDSGHEHFRGSLVIPILDESGQVLGMYGRKINDHLRTGTAYHLYLPGPHRGVWNIEALGASAEVIVCEALIDALTFWCAGYRNVTSSYGVEGFTSDHLDAFKRHGTKRVLIAYDRDEAGGRAAEKLGAKLMAEGSECWRIQFPRGMDANEYALSVQPAQKSLGVAIRSAVWMGKGKAPVVDLGVAPAPMALTVATPARALPVELAEVNLPVEGTSSVSSVATALEASPAAAVSMDAGTLAAPVSSAAVAPSLATTSLAAPAPVLVSQPPLAAESLATGEHGGAMGTPSPAPVQGPAEAASTPAEAVPASAKGMPTSFAPAPPKLTPPVSTSPATAVTASAAPASSTVASVSASTPVSPPLASPAVDLEVQQHGGEVVVRLGDRRWRVRGLEKNLSYDQLRVNVLCGRGEAFHVDTLDLYTARQRALFLKQAAEELGVEEAVLHKDLGKLLLKLEELQDHQIQAALAPKEEAPVMSEAEREAALGLLRDPKLLERILGDFERCGVVGEKTNKLVGYVASVSRKLEMPLAVIIQSSSAAGKSSLMDAILAFVPEEERVKYSAMTGQSLFYMGETNLKHKVLAIVEEAGAERASYALKLLQSEGELCIASTGKDPASGKLVTHEYRVEGPVMIILTTTAIEIDDELLNRCIVLTVDEEREQTRAIHRMQRAARTLEGLWARKDRARVLKLHQDAQRLLRPLWVANPFAEKLTFIDDRTRTRRDHAKYLTLMEAIALLFQYQRPVRVTMREGERVEYVEVTREDVALANELAHEVLGRSLDELPPQTRRLLMMLEAMVSEECTRLAMARTDYRFSRREVRERTGLSYEQVRVHLERLVELEYVLAHKGGRGQSFVYELLYDGGGKDGAPFVMHLLDAAALGGASTTESLGGEKPQFGVPYRGQTGALPAPYRPAEERAKPHGSKARSTLGSRSAENAHQGEESAAASYVAIPAISILAPAKVAARAR